MKRVIFALGIIMSICSHSFAQSTIDFSKYRINLLSKSTKFNCTAFRLTIPIDLNNDGLIDFVTTGDDMGPCGTNGEISYLKFFENDGNDNYIENNIKYAKDSLWVIRPNWYLVEDFNGDGKKDILITGEHIHQQWNSSFLSIYPFIKPNIDVDTSKNFTNLQRRHHLYLSQSDGTYKDSPEFLQGMKTSATFSITAVDYNKDGFMDIIAGIQQPGGWEMEFYTNNAGKSMSRTTPFTVHTVDANNNVYNKARIDSLGGVSEGPENLKFYDVNNDGYLDMIFNDRSGNALCMMSQNKALDLYSPIIKFDDFQTNGLLTNMPGSTVEIRGFYIADIKKDGTKQLIEYWANGGGDYQTGKKLYQLIKIFDIKNGGFVDATNSYFNAGENVGKNYGAGLLALVDVDKDGYIDLFPRVIDHDGKANQGYGSDSTMYYKNQNGKFVLTSLGLKYYFKEFKEMADSMKVYKYDTLHPFSIANSLTPINTGKSNKIIFYSFGTEPGIDASVLIKFPNQYFLNKQRQVYNDSLSTYFKGFILSPVNCNIVKPAFNTSKYSFCSGDSIKLSITNVNKGDTLKWYYGTKSDLTNVTNKTFTDSTKLFVTRTDSLGCVISSDTVSLVKFAIPSAPVLSRDTANNLIASINGITWYKDGNAITDTTQKIKPTTGGSYTAKTTQNGCISALSTPYYYLVTDIINLSADEYIKLAPNPFSNQLNFDFVVKGYQRLNMEVFDLASGSIVASKQNLTPGIPIYLGQLSAGTYVIKVTSNDLKVSYQFKMVKL